MEYKAVRCEKCGLLIYQIKDGVYWIGGIIINHGFSGVCRCCGQEFNTEWIEKNDKR